MLNYLPFLPYPVAGTMEACNLCGSAETVEISRLDRRLKPLTTVACADCGLMRTQPMPTDEELAAYYSSGYRKDYQFASAKPPKTHIVRSMRSGQARLDRLKDHIRPGARVLDFGCGSGEFAYLAQQAGCEVTAFDPGSDYLEFARETYNVDAKAMRWQDADFEPGSFDIVSSFHVVEHLRKPVDAIKKMAEWAADDGVVHIEVPDMRPNHKPSFDRFHFAHVHGFIAETLEAAARVARLQPVGGHLETTIGVFKKISDAESSDLIEITDQTRSQTLQAQYPKDSPVSYALSGRWAKQASHRLSRWRKDQSASTGGQH